MTKTPCYSSKATFRIGCLYTDRGTVLQRCCRVDFNSTLSTFVPAAVYILLLHVERGRMMNLLTARNLWLVNRLLCIFKKRKKTVCMSLRASPPIHFSWPSCANFIPHQVATNGTRTEFLLPSHLAGVSKIGGDGDQSVCGVEIVGKSLLCAERAPHGKKSL